MKPIATLDPDAALRLVDHLRTKHIQCDSRSVSEEGGLVATELLVEETLYDAACEAAETWQVREAEENARKLKRVCPKCRSVHLEFVEHDKLGFIYRCNDCGSMIVPR